ERIVGAPRQGGARGRLGALPILQALERPGEVEAGARVVGARAQHLAKSLGRLAVAALLEEHAAERLARGDGARRQRHRRAHLGLGVGGAAQAAEGDDESESAASAICSLAVTMITGMLSSIFLMSLSTSTPFIRGMLMSSRTTSGRPRSTAVSASVPFSAVSMS